LTETGPANRQNEIMRSLIPFRNWLKLSCHWFKFESSISKGTKQHLYSTFLMLLKPCPLFTTNVLLFVLNLVALLTGVRRVWRHQRSNQNPLIEDEHTTQWPQDKW